MAAPQRIVNHNASSAEHRIPHAGKFLLGIKDEAQSETVLSDEQQ